MPRHKQPVSKEVRQKLSRTLSARQRRALSEEARHNALRQETLARVKRAASTSGMHTFGLPTMPEPLPSNVRVLETSAYAASLSGPARDWAAFDRVYLGLHLVPRRTS